MEMSSDRPELSRWIKAGAIGKAGLEFEIDANEDECAAVALRLGVVAVPKLYAKLEVKRWRRSGARVSAQVTGSLVRRCVVTLEEFTVPVDEDFEVKFADPADDIAMVPTDGELVLDPGSDEPPEILVNGGFDAGEVVVEQLVLGLDPYPRRPGAEFGEVRETPEKSSPFEVLSSLKDPESDPESGA